MASSTELKGVDIQIGQLEKSIEQESLRLIARGTTPAVDDADYQLFFRQLDQWSTRLDSISKRLRSAEHGLALSREQARGSSRDQRFRALQSVSDRERRLAQIRANANRAAAYLTRLYELALAPTAVDVVSRTFRLADGALDEWKNFSRLEKLSLKQTDARTSAIVTKARQEIRVPRSEVTDSLTVLVLVMHLLRIWWLEKLRQERGR